MTQNGKGDARRPGDDAAYRSNHDRIFAPIARDVAFDALAATPGGRARLRVEAASWPARGPCPECGRAFVPHEPTCPLSVIACCPTCTMPAPYHYPDCSHGPRPTSETPTP